MKFILSILLFLVINSFSYADVLKSSGSGVIVNKSTILTNKHVVKDCKRLLVQNSKISISLDTIIYNKDNNLDIALIKSPVDVFNGNIIFSKDDKLKLGDKIYSLGYPGFLGNQIDTVLKYSEGTVSAVLENDGSVIHTAPIYAGSSGSGIFLSNGLFIGLNYGIFKTVQGENLAVELYYIKQFLKNNNVFFNEKSSSYFNFDVVSLESNKENSVQIFCYVEDEILEQEHTNNQSPTNIIFSCQVLGYYDSEKNYISYNKVYKKTIIVNNNFIKVIRNNNTEVIFRVIDSKEEEGRMLVYVDPRRMFVFNSKKEDYMIINEVYQINSLTHIQVDRCLLTGKNYD